MQCSCQISVLFKVATEQVGRQQLHKNKIRPLTESFNSCQGNRYDDDFPGESEAALTTSYHYNQRHYDSIIIAILQVAAITSPMNL